MLESNLFDMQELESALKKRDQAAKKHYVGYLRVKTFSKEIGLKKILFNMQGLESALKKRRDKVGKHII